MEDWVVCPAKGEDHSKREDQVHVRRVSRGGARAEGVKGRCT